MALLDSGDYQEIRALIDSQLTSNDLRDAVIEADVHKGQAERLIIARVSNAQALVDAEGADAERVKYAAKCLVAASLCPVVVRLTALTVQGRDMAYSRQTFDPVKRAAELRAMAEQMIDQLIADTDAVIVSPPTMFSRAAAGRGQ